MDSNENIVLTAGGNGRIPRKKPLRKENWSREVEKRNRYKSKNLPRMPTCSHKGTTFQCRQLTSREVLMFSKAFYASSIKVEQDAFILAYSKVSKPSRTDRRRAGSERSFKCFHYIKSNNGSLKRVCNKTFLNALRISKKRVKGVCSRFMKSGEVPKENRGGDRKSCRFEAKREKIIAFVKKFKPLEVHYCRSKTTSRQYLSGELSINKLCRMYNAIASSEHLVKGSYFRKIFNRSFNIGFKAPSSDKCSTCIMYEDRMKVETDSEKKSQYMVQKRIHKLRAKAFFDLAREEKPGMITFSFDCQKNMVLPKVPDQAAYYSRQLYLYNFCIVQGCSKSSLAKDNVFLYLWTEDTRPKGSNDISSAVYHRLQNTSFELNLSKVRLICDGCGSQNKNCAMMCMLSFWLSREAPKHIREIEVVFPVPGHSFIPPDRVFARLEKLVKAKETIMLPEEYKELYADSGNVIELVSKECAVRDWQRESKEFLRPPGKWHFAFNKAKRFLIEKTTKCNILIKGETAYKSDINVAKSVMKKGKVAVKINAQIINEKPLIKSEKLRDVDNLLKKHCGEDWRSLPNLEFYKNIIENSNGVNCNPVLTDCVCDSQEDDTDLHV